MQSRRRFRFESAGVLQLLRWGSLLVPLMLIAAYASVSWISAIDNARSTARANATQIREFALRLIQTQDTQLVAAEQALLSAPPGSDLRAVQAFIGAVHAKAGTSLGLALIAPDGEYLLSINEYPATGKVGRRDYLDVGMAGEPVLFVDRIKIQPADVDALVVARRHRADPSPGVWVSAVSIAAVTAFLQESTHSPRDSASILRGDGRLLVQSFAMPEVITLEPETPEMRAIRAADRGVFEAEAVADGVTRIFAFERIGDLDLFARYGVSKDALFGAWLRNLAIVAGLLAAIGVVSHSLARYAAHSMASEARRSALEFDRHLLAEAEKTAAAKDMMLKELNHRVKNNLQMIGSLIRLQRNRPGGPDLDAIGSRVMAIAEIHDLLHHSADSFDVDLGALLEAICSNDAIIPPEEAVRLTCEAEPISVDANVATPVALCSIELITNARKHAFGPEGGTIEVRLARDGDLARLTIADNGKGFPAERPHNSGLRVVDALVCQIGGTLCQTRAAGTAIEISFPAPASLDE